MDQLADGLDNQDDINSSSSENEEDTANSERTNQLQPYETMPAGVVLPATGDGYYQQPIDFYASYPDKARPATVAVNGMSSTADNQMFDANKMQPPLPPPLEPHIQMATAETNSSTPVLTHKMMSNKNLNFLMYTNCGPFFFCVCVFFK